MLPHGLPVFLLFFSENLARMSQILYIKEGELIQNPTVLLVNGSDRNKIAISNRLIDDVSAVNLCPKNYQKQPLTDCKASESQDSSIQRVGTSEAIPGAPESIRSSDAEEQVETEQFTVLVHISLVTTSVALVQSEFQAAQQFILTSYHTARIITSEAQRRRKMAQINPEFRSALRKEGDAFSVTNKESVENIKELYKIKNHISTPKDEQQTSTQVKSVTDHTTQANTSSTQTSGIQQTQPIFLVPQYQAPNNYNNQF
ncbi:MAG: hypothetical protein EZS28_002514 [Streblomastix strix]|uniref:Uncharacterized protein n=1 Tax=Streblomastix strix TaxID=222440 RepID=A0A5J4X5Z8_9EUKA|nr:MAG: hypothetical protein EZS28_002514 [Streblomastix strix]